MNAFLGQEISQGAGATVAEREGVSFGDVLDWLGLSNVRVRTDNIEIARGSDGEVLIDTSETPTGTTAKTAGNDLATFIAGVPPWAWIAGAGLSIYFLANPINLTGTRRRRRR
jgi:hypothetical protein